ncbi:MAG: hypothetical protein P9L94_19385 [Candidatus Hinthialibacter antarcticus]|nr:hypothetical protein [Candidatus Hinthialibacter antarcticus]
MNNAATARSEAMKAALLSALVVPGAGQLYNRQWAKAVFVGIVFLIASLALLIPIGYFLAMYFLEIGQGNVEQAADSLQFLSDEFYTFCVLAVASVVLYVYSIYDAYVERKKMESAKPSV